jgi:cyclopropane fatty-acyl-phospholipid synthase-like methyltransferase
MSGWPLSVVKKLMNSSSIFFDRFADKFDGFYDGKRSRFMQWADKRFRSDMFIRFAMAFEFLGDLEGKRVLDIGCGSGPYLAEALKRGALQVTGIDPAPRMLGLAMQRVQQLGASTRASFLKGYFPDQTPEGEFDFAIVMGVTDYLTDVPSFLRSLRSVVTQRAVISFPSIHWFRTPFRKVRYKLRRCPVYFYDASQIETLLQNAGIENYRIIKIPGAGMDYFAGYSI